MSEKIETELLDNFLIVWDPKQGSNLYKFGYYGKPLYLVEKGKIDVFTGKEIKKVTFSKIRTKARKLYEDFDLKYAVYRDLRSQKLVVTPGMKFGCDFAVYQHGPGLDHAPYMVSVRKATDDITATDVVKAGRLATTVRKRFIIAIPDLEAEDIRYLIFKWFKA